MDTTTTDKKPRHNPDTPPGTSPHVPGFFVPARRLKSVKLTNPEPLSGQKGFTTPHKIVLFFCNFVSHFVLNKEKS